MRGVVSGELERSCAERRLHGNQHLYVWMKKARESEGLGIVSQLQKMSDRHACILTTSMCEHKIGRKNA